MEDLIKREDAIITLMLRLPYISRRRAEIIMGHVPSVDRPEGRWKGEGFGDWRCSLCCEVVSTRTKYCPHCGSLME